MRVLTVTILLLLSSFVRADQSPILLGHNLSATNYSLNKHSWSVGTSALMYGISDNLMFAMSPWLYFDYNAYSGIIHYRKKIDDLWSGAIRVAYIKTYDEDKCCNYQMEVSSTYVTFARTINTNFTIHIGLNYMYFFDETIPYSLRREPLNGNPDQLSSTIMFEVNATESFGILFELGVLGINYRFPQVILGSSFHYRTSSWLIQLGLSFTGTPSAFGNPFREDSNYAVQNQMKRTPDEYDMRDDFSIHPEAYIQYYF